MKVHFLSSDLQSNITRGGCGSTKLCVSVPPDCDPAGNSSCIFISTKLSNATLSVEISGTISGYVALGVATTNIQILSSFPVVLLTQKHILLQDKLKNNE